MYSKTVTGGGHGAGANPWKSRNTRGNAGGYPFSMDSGDSGRRGRWGDQGHGATSAGGSVSGSRAGRLNGTGVGIGLSQGCGATIMQDHIAKKIRQFYEQKVDCRKYELVAAFQVERGIVQSYFVYRQRLPFELTERRRQLMGRYYKHGRQEVVLYVNGREFEYYVPVSYQPLKVPTSTHTSNSNSYCSTISHSNTATTTSLATAAAANSPNDEEEGKIVKKSRFKFFNFKS